MTDTEINIAIAKACGWRVENRYPSGQAADFPFTLIRPNGVSTGSFWATAEGAWSHGLPNYCSDLNAMRSARESLSDEQLLDFFRALERIVERDCHGRVVAFAVGRGTARQESEAFLRIHGKRKVP